MNTSKVHYILIAAGASIGLIAAFLQTLEKLVLLEDKNTVLPCNLNDIFNCNTVLSAPQSSLLGFPNSLLCITIFTLLLAIGIVGMTKSHLSKRLLYSMQALAIFTLVFALWFLLTSTYIIGAICIFCLFCFTGLLLINAAFWRINFASIQQKNKLSRLLQDMSAKNFDLALWIGLAVLMAAIIIQRFYM